MWFANWRTTPWTRSIALTWLVAALANVSLTSAALGAEPLIKSGQRIVFLGDSNTHAGTYIVLLETWLRFHYPQGQWTLINLGLPSETASGLSEPAHPFPRPSIHTRLESALSKTRPDVVVICYGTNDGIYYPPSEPRMAAYRQGMEKLIAACRKAGAKVVLLTPPPFDPEPMKAKGQIKAAGADEYAWFAAFEGYDDVLAEYAQWILAQADKVDLVVDIRTPMVAAMKSMDTAASTQRLLPDGIHYSAAGHQIIARQLWNAWHLEPADPTVGPSETLSSAVERRQQLLRDAWLTHVGHQRPGMVAGLPLDQAEAEAAKIIQ